MFSEGDLLNESNIVVVLAEPGAGKTELLNSLARRLGVSPEKASLFRHRKADSGRNSLVLDALDEVAKLDPSGIDALLVKAHETNAAKVVFASRSSEWEDARNNQIKACFGVEPLVVRLEAFNEVEQKQLFSHHFPAESFDEFRAEVSRFELEPLLGNPQFLQLFAEAFVESGRRFSSKQGIFEAAIRRLASVDSNTVIKGFPSVEERLFLASEVFAKLLLSGADGVNVFDVDDDRQFPRLFDLVADNNKVGSILDTRLLKPVSEPDRHEPVHRIVAEYCAAKYLVGRFEDSTAPFTLSQFQALVAPNSVVRDELRGLLGWMAAVGGKAMQEAAIDLDPYAVLANGDPSQLFESSMIRLLDGLQEAATDDPYFRRGDFRRTFSAAGFFTPEVVDKVRTILTSTEEKNQLRGLLLELLEGSPAVTLLAPELRALMLSPDCSNNTRLLAQRCLVSIGELDLSADFDILVSQGSENCLSLAVLIFLESEEAALGREKLLGLLQECARLYPARNELRETILGSRYFVKKLIQKLEPSVVEWLLDELTDGLHCTCGEAKAHNCGCRNGISKVVGLLLDQYFEFSEGPQEPARIWRWAGNLNFHENKSAKDSGSVRRLQSDHSLRQAIHRLVLGDLTDPDEIWDLRHNSFNWQSHSGLSFRPADRSAMVEFAFQNDNAGLWSCFISPHDLYRDTNARGADELRHHMRRHAQMKPDFMKVWAMQNRAFTESYRKHRDRKYWFMRRRNRREKRLDEISIRSLVDDKQQIENGQHWGWLKRFADLYLIEPDKIDKEIQGRVDVEKSLENFFDYLDPHVPGLSQLALGGWQSVVRVLLAGCVVKYRKTGSLDDIGLHVLRAVKTEVDGYPSLSDDEAKSLEAEFDRRIFSDLGAAETFLRDYVEAQLEQGSKGRTDSHWLRHKEEFKPLQGELSIEWLNRFRALSSHTLDSLFDIAAEHADRSKLEDLISTRCAEFFFFWPEEAEDEELESRRKFWFLRYFYFVEESTNITWEWLRGDKNVIFGLSRRSGPWKRGGNPGWPRLSAEKVYAVLDAFIDEWPRVPLRSSFGSSSPKEEKAYRFLKDIVWDISEDDPDTSITVLDRILADKRFENFHTESRNMRAAQIRKMALRDFEAPTPKEIAGLLDQGEIVTVEGLRALLLEELRLLQGAIDGGEFDTVEMFYDGGLHVGENTASKRVAERLQLRLNALNMAITIEHQLKSLKRCDITASKVLGESRKLLVIEAKGQWHSDLFTAAEAQLHERYSIHPDAEHQGIYLVYWFGNGETIAGRKDVSVTSAKQLHQKIIESVPEEIRGLIDVFVLDLSTN